MLQKPLDMVSVQMEAASIIINKWKVFYEDIRDVPDLELVPDLESEDGLEKGVNGCENNVLERGKRGLKREKGVAKGCG